MQVEIKIDPACTEPKVIVVTDKMTDEVNMLVKRLTNDSLALLAGFRGDTLKILEQEAVVRIYAASGKVYARTDDGEYVLRLRLYELEERLDQSSFARISNSEIINLRKVKGFDLSLAGTIHVSFLDGSSTYVSRRYVPRIKQVLGI